MASRFASKLFYFFVLLILITITSNKLINKKQNVLPVSSISTNNINTQSTEIRSNSNIPNSNPNSKANTINTIADTEISSLHTDNKITQTATEVQTSTSPSTQSQTQIQAQITPKIIVAFDINGTLSQRFHPKLLQISTETLEQKLEDFIASNTSNNSNSSNNSNDSNFHYSHNQIKDTYNLFTPSIGKMLNYLLQNNVHIALFSTMKRELVQYIADHLQSKFSLFKSVAHQQKIEVFSQLDCKLVNTQTGFRIKDLTVVVDRFSSFYGKGFAIENTVLVDNNINIIDFKNSQESYLRVFNLDTWLPLGDLKLKDDNERKATINKEKDQLAANSNNYILGVFAEYFLKDDQKSDKMPVSIRQAFSKLTEINDIIGRDNAKEILNSEFVNKMINKGKEVILKQLP